MKTAILISLLVIIGLIFFFVIPSKKKKDILNDSSESMALRKIHSGYSYCSGCGLPWSNCDTKSVYYSASRGTFATCQTCWDSLSLKDLKWCYTQTYKMQVKQSKQDHTLKHLLKCVEKEYNKTK